MTKVADSFKPSVLPQEFRPQLDSPAQPVDTIMRRPPVDPSTLNQFQAELTNPTVVPAQMSDTAKAKKEQAVKNFNNKVMDILNHTAQDMAAGRTPVTSGSDISEAQMKELQTASLDLVKSLPLSSFSPSVLKKIEDRVGPDALKNLGDKSLNDLPGVGEDLAKELLKDLKLDSPGAYYGLATMAGIAIAGYSVVKGSDVLKQFGIEPKLETSLFNDSVKLKATASWEAEMRNFRLQMTGAVTSAGGTTTLTVANQQGNKKGTNPFGGVEASLGHQIGNDRHSLSVGAGVDTQKGFTGAQASGRTTLGPVELSGQGQINPDGSFKDGQVGTTVRIGDEFSVNSQVHLGSDGKPTKASVGLNLDGDIHDVTANVNLGPDGLPTSADARYSNPHVSVGANVRMDRDGIPNAGGLDLSITPELRDGLDLRVTAGVNGSIPDNRVQANLEAALRFQDNMEFILDGEVEEKDGQVEGRVGIGIKATW